MGVLVLWTCILPFASMTKSSSSKSGSSKALISSLSSRDTKSLGVPARRSALEGLGVLMRLDVARGGLGGTLDLALSLVTWAASRGSAEEVGRSSPTPVCWGSDERRSSWLPFLFLTLVLAIRLKPSGKNEWFKNWNWKLSIKESFERNSVDRGRYPKHKSVYC